MIYNNVKIRELAKYIAPKVSDREIENTLVCLITEWLEQNPVYPAVVGLSDVQVKSLAVCLFNNEHQTMTWTETTETVISEFLKAQTFAQTDKLLERQYNAAMKELEQLKSQQFTPDWSASPASAVTCQVVKYFLDDKNNQVDSEILKIEFRPKPTPQVEAGQVWRYKSEGKTGDDYEVTAITKLEGQSKLCNGMWEEDIEIVTYKNNGEVYNRPKEIFLAKFEQVQS
jgi:hypothetical protein